MKSFGLKLLKKLAEAVGETGGDVQKVVIEVGVDCFPRVYVQRVMFENTSDAVLKVVQDSTGLRVEADESVEVIALKEAK